MFKEMDKQTEKQLKDIDDAFDNLKESTDKLNDFRNKSELLNTPKG